MVDKKRPAATAIPKKRRRFDSAGARQAAKCSVGKRTVEDELAVPAAKTKPIQAKFVRAEPRSTSRSANSKGETRSEMSKGMTRPQIACREWFENVHKQGLRHIRKEFIEQIKSHRLNVDEDPSLVTAFIDPANTSKNRYDDVYLLDKTRVKIRINPDNDDYIHASFVDVSKDLTYICAQGPMENTTHQFWLMCIQEDVRVILQLCQNSEDGSEKCSKYVPTGSDSVNFGPVQVKVIKPATAVAGTLKLSRTILQCKFKDKKINLTHLLYFGWPDHTIPESIATCREVRNLVHKIYDKKPIVVHCSAGIGRTGSFVAIEMVANKLLNEFDGKFSMIELMHDLRDKRALAIQTDQQYVFIYRCLLEILTKEDGLARTQEVDKFISECEEMFLRKKKARRAGSKSARHRNKREENN